MATFIELTSKGGDSVMINVDGIAYVDSCSGGSRIHLCVTHISSSDSSGSLRSVSGNAEVIYVKESYQVVKRKIHEL